ncbi:MAG: amino acid-binding protein [Gammaproteobacteria bacterium 28-57-27]|nr:MAG: amino acid-binding protein [Gammaproteobacteria bacterium 28-57-27]
MKTPHWKLLTLVGPDRPGIVAAVSRVLLGAGAELGEASMMRLGGLFTIMLMVGIDGDGVHLKGLLESVRNEFKLRVHVDELNAGLHRRIDPDARVTVYGADRVGIVAEVTDALAQAGLSITDLRSDVAGSEDKPIYIMNIEGVAQQGLPPLEQALARLSSDIRVTIAPIELMRG